MLTFSGEKSENWEQCYFDSTFRVLNTLRNIVQRHGKVLFRPFDKVGLRVDPLVLSVGPNARFNMQSCRFVRKDILSSLQKLIYQFVSEGVLVPESSCSHASSLVIVQ